MISNNSAQLELPHPVPSGMLVCSLRDSPRGQKRGRAKAVSVAPESPSSGVVFFICGKYMFLKFCLVLVGWLVSGT